MGNSSCHICASQQAPLPPLGAEDPRLVDRREFLWRFGGGLGGIAMVHLLGQQGLLAETAVPRAEWNGGLHHRARAKRVVQLFMSGAASQCDTFDYKPDLIKRSGEKFEPGGKVELFQSDPGAVMKSPWDWKQYGQCGKWISDLVPNLGSCADDMAFIHSMVSKSNVHGPATFMQNTGFVLPDVRGLAPNGADNWTAGFLPAAHQGTMIRLGKPNPIYDLFPPKTASFITPESEKETQALLKQLNQAHLAAHPGDSRLDA